MSANNSNCYVKKNMIFVSISIFFSSLIWIQTTHNIFVGPTRMWYHIHRTTKRVSVRKPYSFTVGRIFPVIRKIRCFVYVIHVFVFIVILHNVTEAIFFKEAELITSHAKGIQKEIGFKTVWLVGGSSCFFDMFARPYGVFICIERAVWINCKSFIVRMKISGRITIQACPFDSPRCGDDPFSDLLGTQNSFHLIHSLLMMRKFSKIMKNHTKNNTTMCTHLHIWFICICWLNHWLKLNGCLFYLVGAQTMPTIF